MPGDRSTDGTERPDPIEDPTACSKCGIHIGMLDDEYCDSCVREIGAKPPMERCLHCGRNAPQELMESVDISTPDEYYPEVRYLCQDCSGGESA